MHEVLEVEQLRQLFAQELAAQGVVLPPDEEELILTVCVNAYRSDAAALKVA
jgi:hypothetical protein